MGMTEMFTDNAKLSGVLESGVKLKVSKAVHKAFIEVTEKGTEAGASTGNMFHSIRNKFSWEFNKFQCAFLI